MTRTSWKQAALRILTQDINTAANRKRLSQSNVNHMKKAAEKMTEQELYALRYFLTRNDSDEA
jgi:hypothetical protein